MFDFALFRAINNIAGKWTLLDILGIFAAVYLVFAIVILIALTSFFRRNIYIYLNSAAAAVIGYSLSQLIGIINFRPRPFVFLENVNLLISKSPLSKSFPSDHATLAFALATAFYIFGEKKWGTVALVMAAFVALGRVYVGVHFPFDAAAGSLLGAFSAVLVWKIGKVIKNLFYGQKSK